MTAITLTYQAIQHRVKSFNIPKVNWKVVYCLGMVLFLAMLVFYVYLVNEMTRSVYVIKNYEKEISVLLGENKKLEAHFTKTNLLGKITDKARELSFEKTTNIKYMQILESSLAKVPTVKPSRILD
jgi:hypothetical protein